MEETAQLKQFIIEKLNLLSQDQLIKLLAFINSLISAFHDAKTSTDIPLSLPAPDAFIQYAGTWEFEPGELEKILQDIEQSRLMALEEDRGSLLD